VDYGHSRCDRFPQVVVVGSRGAVQRHEDPGLRFYRANSLDVQSLLGVACNHALEHSMHVANGGCQCIDSGFIHELFGFGGGRESFQQIGRGIVDLRSAADVANLSFHKNVRTQCLQRFDSCFCLTNIFLKGQRRNIEHDPIESRLRSLYGVQWDKDDCADMGIVKVDLLGLGMMAVLENCLELIPKHYDLPIDLAQLPPDDPPVYETLRRADTVGMFQVESRAQMASLPRNAPVKFYDLVVQVAIIRPGPIVGKMMHPYMRRRQGKESVAYAHPSLEPILKRTLGVPLFQEQLLRMAMVAANFTGGEAEDLRRAMGFKRSEERMKKIEAKLRSGMTLNGFRPETQEEIITQISSFARYGFPESHAASFALIAYASAYLKQYYLAAFTAALLNNQPMGFYSPAVLVHDAQLHGLRVKPIDTLQSEWNCTIERARNKEDQEAPCLRIGLRYVRGLRQSTVERIVCERQKRPFEGIDDLVRRVSELQKPELVTLSEIGALNSFRKGLHRRTALWQVERAARPAGPLLDAIPEQMELSPLEQMTDEERLVADFHGSGMSTGPHSMTYCRAALSKQQVKRACDLSRLPDGQYTRVAGCVIARQRPGTAKGFVFLSLEDETGISNVIVNPDLYERYRLVINREKFLRVDGVLQNQDHTISIKASHVQPISITAAETQSHDFH
jgi:error-prone DNA polymerase